MLDIAVGEAKQRDKSAILSAQNIAITKKTLILNIANRKSKIAQEKKLENFI